MTIPASFSLSIALYFQLPTDKKRTEPIALTALIFLLNTPSSRRYAIISSEQEKVPSMYVTLTDEEQIKKMGLLLEKLDENDDVTDVWHNWDE